MEYEVGSMLERPHEPGGGEGRIDQQWHAVLVREFRDTGNIEDVEARITQRFAEEEACVRPDRRAPRVDVTRIDESRLDAEARERVIEEIVRADVERPRRDDMRTQALQRGDRQM